MTAPPGVSPVECWKLSLFRPFKPVLVSRVCLNVAAGEIRQRDEASVTQRDAVLVGTATRARAGLAVVAGGRLEPFVVVPRSIPVLHTCRAGEVGALALPSRLGIDAAGRIGLKCVDTETMNQRLRGVVHRLELTLDGSTGAAAPVAGVHVEAEGRLPLLRVDPAATGEPRTGLTVLRPRREPERRFSARRG